MKTVYKSVTLYDVPVLLAVRGGKAVGYIEEIRTTNHLNRPCVRFRLFATWTGAELTDHREFASRKEAVDAFFASRNEAIRAIEEARNR